MIRRQVQVMGLAVVPARLLPATAVTADSVSLARAGRVLRAVALDLVVQDDPDDGVARLYREAAIGLARHRDAVDRPLGVGLELDVGRLLKDREQIVIGS